jgi:hypothetical protein
LIDPQVEQVVATTAIRRAVTWDPVSFAPLLVASR